MIQKQKTQTTNALRHRLYLLHFTLYTSRGYTLIELLIVIALVGILAGITYVGINPLEYINRARDSQRQQILSDLAKAVAGYYINNRAYPDASVVTTGWINTLVTDNDLTVVPNQVAGSTILCFGYNVNNFCYYSTGTTAAVVYTTLQSKQYLSSLNCQSGQSPVVSWHSNLEKISNECASTTVALTP